MRTRYRAVWRSEVVKPIWVVGQPYPMKGATVAQGEYAPWRATREEAEQDRASLPGETWIQEVTFD